MGTKYDVDISYLVEIALTFRSTPTKMHMNLIDAFIYVEWDWFMVS